MILQVALNFLDLSVYVDYVIKRLGKFLSYSFIFYIKFWVKKQSRVFGQCINDKE